MPLRHRCEGRRRHRARAVVVEAEADLAAGRLVRLLADHEPAGAIAPDVPAVAAGFAEDRAFVYYLVEDWRAA